MYTCSSLLNATCANIAKNPIVMKPMKSVNVKKSLLSLQLKETIDILLLIRLNMYEQCQEQLHISKRFNPVESKLFFSLLCQIILFRLFFDL